TGSAGFGAIRSLAQHVANSADGAEHEGLGAEALHAFMTAAFPVVIGAAIAALAAILLQLGWPPAIKGIKFDMTRMNPLANLKNVFGIGAVARRTGGAAAKMIVVGVVVSAALTGVTRAHPRSAQDFISMAGGTITKVLELVVGALLAIAAVDFYFSKKKLNDQMMMSFDEIKREHKEQEGDPHIKGKRRQKMREMAKRRMAKAVAKADVVIVNPTHYAVALKYDDKKDAAPVVVAKGMDESAEKIREIARKHGVPVISRPPLTRALHKLVKEGKPVPQNLYRAVAEVLAYVYRIKNGGAA
ncbi:MAG TPA: EscU/YscU/HrcU family type III secretion system export apparatus switch protein, partial [Kofleriaceae bacterium]